MNLWLWNKSTVPFMPGALYIHTTNSLTKTRKGNSNLHKMEKGRKGIKGGKGKEVNLHPTYSGLFSFNWLVENRGVSNSSLKSMNLWDDALLKLQQGKRAQFRTHKRLNSAEASFLHYKVKAKKESEKRMHFNWIWRHLLQMGSNIKWSRTANPRNSCSSFQNSTQVES